MEQLKKGDDLMIIPFLLAIGKILDCDFLT